VLAAFLGVAGLVALAPENLPRLDSISISLPVLAFALLLSTAVAAGLGLFTVVRATGTHPRERLVEDGRGQAGSRKSHRVGEVIVAAQMAITLILVIGAGLLGRSLMKVLEVNPGFRVDRILTMDVALPWVEDAKVKTEQGIFFSNLVQRLKGIPGVRKVGATSGLPMDGGLPDGMFLLMTQKETPKTMEGFGALFQQKERIGNADFCVATDGFFEALAIPLIRGRIFDERDGANAPHVAVISESLARERWPNQDPLGHTIEFGNMDGDVRLLTVVGIVGDTHEYGLEALPRPTVYVNLYQRPRAAMTVTMLSDGDAGSVVSAARGILQELNPEIPASFRTFSEVYSSALGSRKFNVILIGFFGASALLLAIAGIFGVIAYSVSRRTREIGVRIALGARSEQVLGMILSQGGADDFYRGRDWDRRRVGCYAHGEIAAFWRDRDRSADICRSNTAAGRVGLAGMLHSSPAGHAGGPNDCVALRIEWRGPERRSTNTANENQVPTARRLLMNSMMSWVEVPGRKISAMPDFFMAGMSASGMMPPTRTTTSSMPLDLRRAISWGQMVLCAPERMERPMTSTSSWMAALAIISGVWRKPV
jgi:MacB-like periplasmic core domain